MTREDFVEEMDRHLKLVRTEYGFTQEVMARVLGLSKKTLIANVLGLCADTVFSYDASLLDPGSAWSVAPSSAKVA